uniref:KRAB domain-containing protein n=1 Tax=Pelusios castaneus TaxID=367368 RepID=A0A8C8VPC3_9SAUR
LGVPVQFEDVAVTLSEAEWLLLDEEKQQLYRDVMYENYRTISSVGELGYYPRFLLPAKQPTPPRELTFLAAAMVSTKS